MLEKRRKYKILFHALAILALCMQFTAHLSPVLAEINGNLQITICSGADFKTIKIDENGEQVPEAPNMRAHDCAFCMAGSTLALPTTPLETNLLTHAYDVKFNLQESPLKLSTYRNRAHAVRAPPALS